MFLGSIQTFEKRFAFEQFHDNEWLTSIVLDSVNCADVGMIQGGCGLRFALEPLQGDRISGQLFREELQCYLAAQFEIFGLIDHAHATAADDFQDSIMRDPLSYQ